jgi:hypothetical protein
MLALHSIEGMDPTPRWHYDSFVFWPSIAVSYYRFMLATRLVMRTLQASCSPIVASSLRSALQSPFTPPSSLVFPCYVGVVIATHYNMGMKCPSKTHACQSVVPLGSGGTLRGA